MPKVQLPIFPAGSVEINRVGCGTDYVIAASKIHFNVIFSKLGESRLKDLRANISRDTKRRSMEPKEEFSEHEENGDNCQQRWILRLDDKRAVFDSNHLDCPRIRERVFGRIFYSSLTSSSRSSSFFACHPGFCAILWYDHADLDASDIDIPSPISLADVAMAG
jgi:hypothetical protein